MVAFNIAIMTRSKCFCCAFAYFKNIKLCYIYTVSCVHILVFIYLLRVMQLGDITDYNSSGFFFLNILNKWNWQSIFSTK